MSSLEVGNAIDISNDFAYRAFAVPNDADVEDVQKIIANALFKQQNLSSVDPSNVYSKDSSFDQGVSQHLMIDHDTDVLGTNFAIAFKTGTSAVDPSFNDTNVVTNVSPNLTKIVKLDASSAIFYDSALEFDFTDGLTNNSVTEDNVTVVFDPSQDLSYNMFKAVNSQHGRDDGSKGLKVVDANNNNALLYEGNVTRGTNNVLVYEPRFTNDLSANGYEQPVFVTASANAFIGAIKLVQPSANDNITITNNVDNSNSTLVDGSGQTITTTSLTDSEIIDKFGQVKFDGYRLDVSGNAGGGYSVSVDLSNVVTLDDTDISRNTNYMSTLQDFSDVSHVLHVTNGRVDISGNNSDNYYEIVNSTAYEYLHGTEYNSIGSISINSDNRVRAVGDLSANLGITYDHERTKLPADSSNNYLSADGSNNYYNTKDISFNVECLLGRTDASNDKWTNVIGRDKDALLLENSGPTNDISLQLINRDVSDNQVLLLLIKQYMDLAEESGLLTGNSNGPTVDSSGVLTGGLVDEGFVEVDVTNVDLNLAPYNGSDLRVQLRAKSASELDSFDLSGVGLLDVSGSYLVSSKQNLSILGDRVYDYISSNNSFKVEHKYYTNTNAKNVDTLIRQVIMNAELSENGQTTTTSVTLQQNELEFFSDASYSEPLSSTYLDIPPLTDPSLNDDPSYVTIDSVTYQVRKFVKRITYYLRHKVLLGPYQNLHFKLGEITETTTRYALWNTDKNRYAPDYYLLYNQQLSHLIPSRVISANNRNTNTSQSGNELITTVTVAPENLRGYDATLQVLNDESWVNVTGANADADLCFDQDTVISVLNNGTMTLKVDVPKNIILDEYYYINLTNKDDTGITGTVNGKLYSAQDLSNSAWDLSGVMTALPDNGVEIGQLTLDVSYGSVGSNGQTEVFYKVKEGSTTIVELKSTSTIISTFKVLKNTRAKFKIVESKIVESGVVNQTNYDSASGLNNHTLVQGANMTFVDDVMRNEAKVFTLLFDKVTASLYSGSITNYDNSDADTSRNIVDSPNATKARAVRLLRYRGLENATIERTPSEMQFKVIKGSVEYSQPVEDIYVDKMYDIDASFALGALGIVFTGQASMFDTNKTVPVNVTFGSYTVSDNRDPSFNDEIFTNNYTIYNLEDYDGVSFYASRVRVEGDERFTLSIGVPDLTVYRTNDETTIIGDLSNATWNFSQNLSHSDLLNGVVLNGTSIRIERKTDRPLGHTVYINAPAPQFYVEATNFTNVLDIVFNPNGVTVDRKYLDYVVDPVDNYKPFTGVSGSNDLEVQLPSSAGDLINKRSTDINVEIPIETNKLKLKLCAMDISGNVLSTPLPYTIFDDFVRVFDLSNNNGNYLAWNASYNSATGLVNDIKVETRLTPTSSVVDNQVYNLLFGDVHIFALGKYYLKMQPGNRVYTSVYGHTYSYKSDKSLDLNLVRYDTAIGIDFDPYGTGSMFRSYIPIATDKYIATIDVSNNNELHSTIAYNFNSILNNVTISNLNWTKVSSDTFDPNELQLSIVCLTTVGQDLLRRLLAVNVDYPAKVLLCHHPDVLRVTGADGSVRFRINAHGRIVGLSAAVQKLSLYPRPENGNNVLNELFNYDITNMGGL